jgi:hypothetical protein
LGAIFTVIGGGQVPLGIQEGKLLSVDKTHVEVELASGGTLKCAVDNRTFIDRQRRRISLNELKEGDFLEMVTERHGPLRPCFARMIHLTSGQLRFGGRYEVGQVKRATETISPRGNVQIAGVVRDLQPTALELRTKQGETFQVRLRPDTIWVRDGVRVERDVLEVNQMVSLRCGYSLSGELEAYQLVWGSILPR